jgi:hypothetical protein
MQDIDGMSSINPTVTKPAFKNNETPSVRPGAAFHVFD